MSTACQFLNLDKYEKRNKIGEGGFGEVFKVISKDTGNIYAAKIAFSTLNTNYNESFLNLSR